MNCLSLRIAERELTKKTRLKLKEIEDERVAQGGSRLKPRDFAAWANGKWESIEVPLVPVPYRGAMWVARMSHNSDDVWRAIGALAECSELLHMPDSFSIQFNFLSFKFMLSNI